MLKKKLGEQKTEQLVSFIKSEIREEIKRKSETLATKEDFVTTESKLILWASVFWATQQGTIFAFLSLLIAK